jgi:ubiquinone/menaquinone biosynthesis C-methylase UbiE
MALASLGVGESFGIDIDFERYAGDVEWRMLHEQFLHVAKRSAAARVGVGDAMALAFSDESFDIVHSTVALEHIARPELAFREAVRVLKPGGIAYFEVGPWFGPDGGHSLCTLDCPWGHVRLNPVQFENYLAAFRPNERTTAISYYRGGFQTPRLTLAETEAMVLDSSFRILEWYESRHKYADHYQFLTPELLADCQRLNRFVTVRDLMSSSYTMLLEKL